MGRPDARLLRRYHAYGLTIATPLALPIPRARARSPVDLVLAPAGRAKIGPPGPGRSWFRYDRGPDDAARLEWRGLFSFEVSADGRLVRYRRHAGASGDALGTYLLGHVISFALVARGGEPLHGTAVALGTDVVVLLGECGEGKSTLGAALLARGGRLVTDDLVVLTRARAGYRVEPGPPRIKLYPRVAGALLGRGRGPRMHRETRKIVVPLPPRARATSPGRLRAFYVIDRARATASRRVRIEALSPAAAVVELVRASFNLTVPGAARERRRFALASALARAVPVRRLIYPRTLAALPAVCDAILGDLQTDAR